MITNENKVAQVNSLEKKVCDFRYITEMVNGNKHLIKGIMDVFLLQVPEDILCINEAVSKADYPTIKNYSHAMKSSVSIMGIFLLSSVLIEMEDLGKKAIDIEKIKELNLNLNLICKQAIKEIEIEKLNYI